MADPKADPVLNALQEKLARYEAAGMTDQVEQVKARIAKREKGVPKAAPAARLTDERTRRSSDVATLSAPKKAAKSAAKKK